MSTGRMANNKTFIPVKGTKVIRGTTQFNRLQQSDTLHVPVHFTAFNAGLRYDFSSTAWRAGSKKIISEDLSAGESSSLLESFPLLFLFNAFEC